MAIKIFFCGEVVADLRERQQGSGNFEFSFGGSQFLGARGAARILTHERLDCDVGFVGPMSKDIFGERFFRALQESKIDIEGVRRVDRNTTLAIVSIQPGKENAFSFYGRDTAEQMTKIEDLPVILGRPADKKICCFGSISTVLEPARFAWLEFASRQRADALVCYDLNTRPSIARDPQRYRGIVLEWAKTAHVMKASDADIGWAYPGMSMQDIAALWHEAGASMAVFTQGPHGSQAFTKSVSARAEAPSLHAENTVGAGHNFNSGLSVSLAKLGCTTPDAIAKLTEGRPQEVLSAANQAAAAHLVSIGARAA